MTSSTNGKSLRYKWRGADESEPLRFQTESGAAHTCTTRKQRYPSKRIASGHEIFTKELLDFIIINIAIKLILSDEADQYILKIVGGIAFN